MTQKISYLNKIKGFNFQRFHTVKRVRCLRHIKFILWVCVLVSVVPNFIATAEPSSVQLIQNGDFSKEIADWNVVVPGDAAATALSVADGYDGKPALKIEITKGSDNSNIAISQRNLKIRSGKHTLTGWVKSDTSGKLMCILKDHKDSSSLGLKKKIASKDTWTQFKFEFTSERSSENGRLQFNSFSPVPGVFWFADLNLTAADGTPADSATAAPVPPKGEKAPSEVKEKPVSSPSPIKPAPESGTIGRIKTIDLKTQSITIVNSKSKEDELYGITPTTQIMMKNATGSIQSLKTGMEVNIVPATDPLNAEAIKVLK